MKNKKMILWTIVAVLLALGVTYLDVLNADNIKFSYKYLIKYNDGFEPGSSYDIYVSQNYRILVERTMYCTTRECIESGNVSSKKLYNVKVSYENKSKLKKFLNSLFKDVKDNKIEWREYSRPENEQHALSAIIYNDELFWDYYE